jgi:hypothetical protein
MGCRCSLTPVRSTRSRSRPRHCRKA